MAVSKSQNKKEVQAGDTVEIHLQKIIYEGTLLESPESEKDIILLKLGSGYNIGFNKKDVLEVKFLERDEERKKKTELKNDSQKPNIAMIITGGTIASKVDPKTGAVNALSSPEDFFESYPEIFEKVNVLKIDAPFVKLSENMNYSDWQKIAKAAEKFLNDSNIKGVVITHGTDTLNYTGAALSFFLKNLNKPVVLTYSQKSIDRASSDASLNLRCAIMAAISEVAEVMIVGHATSDDDFCYAHLANKTKKLHSTRRDTFKSVNSKPLAKIYPDKIIILGEYNPKSKEKVYVDSKFDGNIALIKFYPGQDPSILDYYLKNKYKAVIIEVLGLGHLSVTPSDWIKKIKEVSEKGMNVFATAQTIYGRLNPYVYSSGRKLVESGVIFLEDMLSETAFVKLGWVLGHPDWNVKEKMLENINKEFNDRIEE